MITSCVISLKMSPICHWVKKANQSKYKNSPCDWCDIKWSEWFLLQCEILSWWFRKSVVNVTEKAGFIIWQIQVWRLQIHWMLFVSCAWHAEFAITPISTQTMICKAYTKYRLSFFFTYMTYWGKKITKVGLYYWQKSMLTCTLRPERNWHFADNISQHLIWIITCVMCMRCRFFFLILI